MNQKSPNEITSGILQSYANENAINCPKILIFAIFVQEGRSIDVDIYGYDVNFKINENVYELKSLIEHVRSPFNYIDHYMAYRKIKKTIGIYLMTI